MQEAVWIISQNSICCLIYSVFVLWRYETDGTVESHDEILNFLSMCVYMFVHSLVHISTV